MPDAEPGAADFFGAQLKAQRAKRGWTQVERSSPTRPSLRPSLQAGKDEGFQPLGYGLLINAPARPRSRGIGAIYPTGLRALLQAVLTGGPPGEPVTLA